MNAKSRNLQTQHSLPIDFVLLFVEGQVLNNVSRRYTYLGTREKYISELILENPSSPIHPLYHFSYPSPRNGTSKSKILDIAKTFRDCVQPPPIYRDRAQLKVFTVPVYYIVYLLLECIVVPPRIILTP